MPYGQEMDWVYSTTVGACMAYITSATMYYSQFTGNNRLTDLAPFAGEKEICVDVLLTELFRNVEAEGTITVINAAFS